MVSSDINEELFYPDLWMRVAYRGGFMDDSGVPSGIYG